MFTLCTYLLFIDGYIRCFEKSMVPALHVLKAIDGYAGEILQLHEHVISTWFFAL